MKSGPPTFSQSVSTAEILKAYRCSNAGERTIADEVKGYLLLNLADLAVEVLERASARSPVNGNLEALGLLAHEQNGMPASELADRALSLLERYPGHRLILEHAILYLGTAERYEEALGLEKRYRRSGKLKGSDLHTLACAAAGTHDYPRALRLAVSSVPELWWPGNLINDSQLRPLWQHYAGIDPRVGEAGLLLSVELHEALDEAIDSEIPCSVCEYTTRRVLPEKFRPWMQRTASSHFEMAPAAPRELVHAFRQWLEDNRRQSIRLVRRAIHRAGQVIAAHDREQRQNPRTTHEDSSW